MLKGRNCRGFSLLEILVVLVILGLLAGLVGPKLFSKIDSAKVKTAESQVKMLKTSLQTFRLDVGRYPSSDEGLNALVVNVASISGWQGPYLDEGVPLDPWGNSYVYELKPSQYQEFSLYSFGEDGQKAGDDNAQDIGYLPQ